MPPSMCIGLWQWRNQLPGLWAVNSRTAETVLPEVEAARGLLRSPGLRPLVPFVDDEHLLANRTVPGLQTREHPGTRPVRGEDKIVAFARRDRHGVHLDGLDQRVPVGVR